MGLEHGEMQLRHQHVRIVARVADDCDAICVSLYVYSVRTEQEFRWVITLVEERMAGRPVAVQAFQVELRTARIVQLRSIGVASQNGPVCRNIVRHKLSEDRPTRGAVTEGIG